MALRAISKSTWLIISSAVKGAIAAISVATVQDRRAYLAGTSAIRGLPRQQNLPYNFSRKMSRHTELATYWGRHE